MTPETKAALERLRADLAIHAPSPETPPMAVKVQGADLATALAEIDRLTAAVKEMARMIAEERADTTVSDRARAAGYEAGQREMRERAAHRISCPCWVDFPGPGQGCEDPRGCFENAPDEIRALPILPEPQEGQS